MTGKSIRSREKLAGLYRHHVSMVCVGNPQKTTLTFGFEELANPTRFQGGTLSILGRTFSLDGLSPAA